MTSKKEHSFRIQPNVLADFRVAAKELKKEHPKVDIGDAVGGALLVFMGLSRPEQVRAAEASWYYPAKRDEGVSPLPAAIVAAVATTEATRRLARKAKQRPAKTAEE